MYGKGDRKLKVCRMCWTLLDEQFDRCDCIQGATPSVFFKDTSEMVNHFVKSYKEKAGNLDYLLTYFVCDNFKQLDELLKARSHEVISLLEKNEQLEETMIELRADLE